MQWLQGFRLPNFWVPSSRRGEPPHRRMQKQPCSPPVHPTRVHAIGTRTDGHPGPGLAQAPGSTAGTASCELRKYQPLRLRLALQQRSSAFQNLQASAASPASRQRLSGSLVPSRPWQCGFASVSITPPPRAQPLLRTERWRGGWAV